MGVAMDRKQSYNRVSINTEKRRRGGQPNNHNAFKHGFYSDQFKQAERISLGRIKNTDLTGEVEVVRVQILRYLEAENLVLNEIDYETRLQSLRAVSLATESLTRLIRTQIILNTVPHELENDQENSQLIDDIVD